MDISGCASDLKLHHFGIVVADIEREVEGYAKNFGYVRCGGIVHDPVQTAHVQFLRLPGDQSFLELVSPTGSNSVLQNALSKGGGLHHVCFATIDIDGTCERLTAEGMFLIRRPVAAVAFCGRRVAWLMGRGRVLTEIVEASRDGSL